jgi:hypothetical protein
MAGEPQSRTQSGGTVLFGRRLLTCPVCGWVHYAMTTEEKQGDRLAERYQFTAAERLMYEFSFRQCLRCESPAADFRIACESDLARAQSHLVTPVYVEPKAGVN